MSAYPSVMQTDIIRKTDRYRDRQTNKLVNIQINSQTDSHTQVSRQTGTSGCIAADGFGCGVVSAAGC